MSQSKKIVKYAEAYGVEVGLRAGVVTVDHPDIPNGYPATTSRVVSIGENGEFETTFSRYVPHNDAYVV